MITFSERATSPSVTAATPSSQLVSKPSIRQRVQSWGINLTSAGALHQGFLSLADQAVASITNFVTGVIIARASSKEEFGLYMLGFTLILLVTDLQTSLFATPYMVYAPRLTGDAHARYSGSTLIHQTAFSLLTMVGLTCGAIAANYGVGPHGLEPVLWSLAAVAAFIMLREFVRRMCFARLKLKTVFVFDACVGAAQVGGLLLLARLRLLHASSAYWLIGTVCAVAVFWWLWADRKSYRLGAAESIDDFKKSWLFGKWVFASGLLWACSTNLYPWLLAFFHGTGAAGLFAACLGVISASNPVLLGLQNFLGPKIVHQYAVSGSRGLRKFLFRTTAILALPVCLLAVALILRGDHFIGVLYGSRYAGNGRVVEVLALNLVVTALAFPFSRALFALERANIDFMLNFAALFVMVTLGLWLVRFYGPLGAAEGLFAANLVTSLIRVGAFVKYSTRVHHEQECLR